jgi:hypothetical protein
MLKCIAALVCGVVTLAGLVVWATAAPAEDKKDTAALSGTWMMKGGEMKIVFADKETMKVYPHGNKEDVLAIVCGYTVEKDGLVKAKVNELQGEAKDKAKDHVPVGVEFTFKWKVKDDTAKLDDVKGEKADVFKNHMEGEYEKK